MTKTFEQQEIVENAERMKLIARLSFARCAKCKHDKTVDCGCEASAKLKEITQNWKGQVNVVKAESGEICFKDGKLTLEKYQQAKKQGLSDNKIMEQLGWYKSKMYAWKKDNGLTKPNKNSVKIRDMEMPKFPKINVPKLDVKPLLPTAPSSEPRSEYDEAADEELKEVKVERDELQIENMALKVKCEEMYREIKSLPTIKQYETAEHYVNQTKLLNDALQGQVDRLAKELEETKKSQSGNWRELEQQVKADKLEYEKLVKDYEVLHESNARKIRHIGLLTKENDRLNELNTLLMENTLKIVERAGDIA